MNPLFLNALSGLTTPKQVVNPNLHGVDEQGRYVDAQGNPTSLVITPGLATAIFNPGEYNRLRDINTEAQLAPYRAQEQDALNRSIIGRHVDTMPATDNPYYHSFVTPTDDSYNLPNPKDYMTKQRAAWISSLQDPALSPSNNRIQGYAEGQNGTGLIGQTGALDANTGFMGAERNNMLAGGALSRTPLDIANENATAINNWATATKVDPLKIKLWSEMFAREYNRQPTLDDIKDNQASIDSATTAAQKENIGTTVKTIGQDTANALASSNLHGTQLGNEQAQADAAAKHRDWIGNTVSNNLLKEYMGSSQAPLGESPLIGNVNAGAGNITRGVNPLFASNMDKMQYMTGQTGNAFGIPGAVGQHVWSAPSATDSGTNNTIANPQPHTGLNPGISPQAQGMQSNEQALGVEDVLPRYGLRINDHGTIERADNPNAEMTPEQRQAADNILHLFRQGKLKQKGGYAKQSLYGSILQGSAPQGGSTIASIPGY